MLIVVAGLIYRDEKLLIAQRPAGKHGALKWEFPGGKLEENEDPRDCLVREIKEELGIEVRVERIADVLFHRYPDRSVLLLFYLCRFINGEGSPIEVADFLWVDPADLLKYDFLAADSDLIQRLASGFRY
jgi:8-oxo-dGTP diphosphatase